MNLPKPQLSPRLFIYLLFGFVILILAVEGGYYFLYLKSGVPFVTNSQFSEWKNLPFEMNTNVGIYNASYYNPSGEIVGFRGFIEKIESPFIEVSIGSEKYIFFIDKKSVFLVLKGWRPEIINRGPEYVAGSESATLSSPLINRVSLKDIRAGDLVNILARRDRFGRLVILSLSAYR